ncbi:MAG: hypothetical protein CM15mP74_12020 [Halieaceae bacterium]|nr:MAG: hypothetical protein CM15mP74_12020 [Halieaceae bacterium]
MSARQTIMRWYLTRVSRVSRAVAPSSGSRPHGPLAVLPLPSGNRSEQRYNVVWSMSDAQLSVVSQLDDAAFINEFQGALWWRLGRVRAVGKRSQWPLGRLATTEQFRSGICW